MRRLLLPLLAALAAAGCVSVASLPDPHGTLKPGQRVVVALFPSPGPWIVGSTDSKAEAAAKITPLGFLVQSVEDEHTLSISKNLQQYLPRPRLGAAVQQSLLSALRTARSTSTVQTAAEAGIVSAQLADWNKSKDQLDWRQRYYAPDPDSPAPRDYARLLSLDDALILDVNVSFGTDANEAGSLVPTMTAASRVYRGDTSRLLWEHEDVVNDASISSASITDYMVAPATLSTSLEKLAPGLGAAIANSFIQAFTYRASTSTTFVAISTPSAIGGGGGGLVNMSAFANLSTATLSGLTPSISTAAALSLSTPTISVPTPAVAVSTSAAAVSVSTQAISVPTPAISISTPAVSVPMPAVSVSTPAVSVSTPAAPTPIPSTP